jgi:DNA-binding MarR family transcriptional regulator
MQETKRNKPYENRSILLRSKISLNPLIDKFPHALALPMDSKKINNQIADESDVSLPYDLYILRSLRKIIRAIDLHSRNLKDTFGLTVPQLLCLSAIVKEKRLTAIELSKAVRISPSTIVGILDRLEMKQVITRERGFSDRRQTFISPTPAGEETIRNAPSPLQNNLADGLKNMSSRQRANIAHSLKIIVDLMEARHVRAAPLLTLEGRSYARKKPQHGNKKKTRRKSGA